MDTKPEELKTFVKSDKDVAEAIEKLRKATEHEEHMNELYKPTVFQPNKGPERR